MKAGRRLGQKINPRDERGWLVPRDGTVRRLVYNKMREGRGTKGIAESLGISYQACIMHQQYITKTDRMNALKYNLEHPDEPIPVPMSAGEIQVRNATIEECAQIAEGLNGWGSPMAPELAYHIAKIIRERAAR